MGKECFIADLTITGGGSQSLEIDGTKGIATFGMDTSILGKEKDLFAPCVLATWNVSDGKRRVKIPNVRDCQKCTREVGFKPTREK